MSGRDVLVFAECREGVLADISVDVAAGAHRLARQLGGQAIAVLLGRGGAAHVGALTAADRIVVLEDPELDHFAPEPYCDAFKRLIRDEQPRLVLFGYTSIAADLVAMLGACLDVPAISGCRAIEVAAGSVRVAAGLYGGKLEADVEVESSPALLLIQPGTFRASGERGAARLEVHKESLGLQSGSITFERFIEPEAGDVDITQQEVLVSVGRGIQQKDGIDVAEELAELLGGAVSASRPVVDMKWLPPTRQVGKSGMIVKPKLYLALGISGAPEHLEGMSEAETVLAINTDPKAPIFDVAEYGVIHDVTELVPALVEALEARGN